MGVKKPYLYEVGEIVNETLKIVEQIRVKKTEKYTQKGYIVKSLIYPSDKNDYEMTEGNLKAGQGCAYVAGQRVCPENSLWGVESIRSHIIDINEAKQTTSQSAKPILFKCSTDGCDVTKIIRTDSLVNQGFSCLKCSTHVSYGERLVLSVDEYFDLGLEYQKRLPGLENLIFDFVDYPNKKVYEIQGLQHYKPNDFYGGVEQFGKQKASDLIKRNYCESIGWTYVAIDARKSDFNFIKDNINACEHLPTIKKEDEKFIMELIERNSKYNVAEIIKLYVVDKLTTYQIGEIYNKSNVTVGNILKRNGIKLIDGGKPKCKIRCIETGMIFPSTHQASRETGLSQANISAVCNGKRKTAGGYHWELYLN